LQRSFAPEFLNRIDDVIIFNSLTKENIKAIISIVMKGLVDRINELGFAIELTEKAEDFLADKGFDPLYGARPIHRAIQKYMEEPISEIILKGDLQEGDTLLVDHSGGDEESLILKAKKASKKAPKKSEEE